MRQWSWPQWVGLMGAVTPLAGVVILYFLNFFFPVIPTSPLCRQVEITLQHAVECLSSPGTWEQWGRINKSFGYSLEVELSPISCPRYINRAFEYGLSGGLVRALVAAHKSDMSIKGIIEESMDENFCKIAADQGWLDVERESEFEQSKKTNIPNTTEDKNEL